MKIERNQLSRLATCLDQLAGKELPVWHELSMNIRALRPHFVDYQNDVNNVVEKYGKRKDDGTIDWGKNSRNADKEFTDINTKVIDVDFTPININKVKNYNLPAGITEPLIDVILIEAKVEELELEEA